MNPETIWAPRTSNCRRILLSLAIVLLAHMLSTESFGQIQPGKAKSFRDRVADKATLKDGTQLWGMAVSEKPPRLLMQTSWLKAGKLEFYTNRILPGLKNGVQPDGSKLADQLHKDIEQLQQKNDAGDQQRIGLLMEILDRLTPDEATDPEFVIVEFPQSQLRKLETQPAARRELCRLAMLNHVQDVEELDWKAVTAQLQAIPENLRRVALPQQPENLDRDRILAAVDVRLNMATRLIQSGGNIIDEKAQPDLAALVNSMLGGNLQNLLSELLDEGSRPAPKATVGSSLPEAASRLAESQKRSTVVLSGFEFDIASGAATVTRQLFRKTDDGQWKSVLAASGSSAASELKPGQVEAIENDPQIQEIAGVIQGLGLGNEQFSNALRMGAVVRNAMTRAEQSFEDELQSYITAKGLSQAHHVPTVRLTEPDVSNECP